MTSSLLIFEYVLLSPLNYSFLGGNKEQAGQECFGKSE